MLPPESGMKLNSRREEGQTFIAGHPLARPGSAMIGVIGGSGLASPTLLSDRRDTFTVTPYGAPPGPRGLPRPRDGRGAVLAPPRPGHKNPPHPLSPPANPVGPPGCGGAPILAPP